MITEIAALYIVFGFNGNASFYNETKSKEILEITSHDNEEPQLLLLLNRPHHTAQGKVR